MSAVRLFIAVPGRCNRSSGTQAREFDSGSPERASGVFGEVAANAGPPCWFILSRFRRLPVRVRVTASLVPAALYPIVSLSWIYRSEIHDYGMRQVKLLRVLILQSS
jgi:hypothetical protein